MDFEESHAVRKNVQLLLDGGLRWGSDADHLIFRSVGAGLAIKMNPYLTLSPYYNFISTDSTPNQIAHENRISLAATVGIRHATFTVSDRNLFERRFLPTRETWRYRNRVELERSIRLAHTSLRAFVWDEVFYDSAAKAWTRNRAAIGAGKAITPHLSVDLYYVHQNDSHIRPGNLNVAGMMIRTCF